MGIEIGDMVVGKGEYPPKEPRLVLDILWNGLAKLEAKGWHHGYNGVVFQYECNLQKATDELSNQ